MPPSDPIEFTHDHYRWVARQWPNSEGKPPRFWQIKPKFEGAAPDIRAWWRACDYFERSCA